MERAVRRSDQAPAQDFESSLPDVEALGRLVSPSSPRHRSLRELHALLVACRPGATLAQRVEALEQLARWLQSNRAVAPTPDAAPGDGPGVMRLRMLLRAIETVPPLGSGLAHAREETRR
jgi:hypothetical protein